MIDFRSGIHILKQKNLNQPATLLRLDYLLLHLCLAGRSVNSEKLEKLRDRYYFPALGSRSPSLLNTYEH